MVLSHHPWLRNLAHLELLYMANNSFSWFLSSEFGLNKLSYVVIPVLPLLCCSLTWTHVFIQEFQVICFLTIVIWQEEYLVEFGIWLRWVSDYWHFRWLKRVASDMLCCYRFSEILILGNNTLNRTIPRELMNLSLLHQLSLEDHHLSGPLLPMFNSTS